MKQRRVGTVTLGVMLIAVGIISVFSLIDRTRAMQYMSFLPLILVALGVEILVYAIRIKDEKLKYDGLSIFFVILLTFVSLSASLITGLINRGIEYDNRYLEARNVIADAADESDLSYGYIRSYDNSYFGEFFRMAANSEYTLKNMQIAVNITDSTTLDSLSVSLTTFLNELRGSAVQEVTVSFSGEMTSKEDNSKMFISDIQFRIKDGDITNEKVHKKLIDAAYTEIYGYYYDVEDDFSRGDLPDPSFEIEAYSDAPSEPAP